MNKRLLILATYSLFVVTSRSQIQSPGVPLSNSFSLRATVHTISMPAIDVNALRAEDRIDAQRKDTPPRFGYPFMIDYGIGNAGTWDTLADGRKTWRLRLQSNDALSLNLIFNRFFLPSGSSLFVYNEDKSMVLGAFTERNNLLERVFSTAPVKGDRIIIEYDEPAFVSVPAELNISVVVHAYKDIFQLSDPARDNFGDAGSCEINVNCPVGDPWKLQARSVAMILLASNSRICSGALINNTRNDGTPLFLTANHCWDASQPTWIFMFKYESPNCTNIDGPTTNTISGSALLAKNPDSDFCLLRLSSTPPASYNAYYAGWNRQDVAATSGAGIHHPSGDIKKISFSNTSFLNSTWSGTPANSHWQVNWSSVAGTTAVTEGGSSGSPIFDQSKRIVGQLHGGPSFCGAPAGSLNDLYGKFSMSWDRGTTPATRLKDWLDSLNAGVLTLDGFDPNPIAYAILSDTFWNGNRSLNNVAMTDPDGVVSTGLDAPRVYWKVNNGGWTSAATTSSGSPFNFIIGTTGLNVGDTVRYFTIAQDILGNVFANPGTGLVATSVNSVTTHPSNPNSYAILANPNYGGGLASQGLYFFANSTPGAIGAPSQPSFGWRDTTGSTSLIANGVDVSGGLLTGSIDDGYLSLIGKLPPGNSFRFFGTLYSNLYLGTNGIVAFNTFTAGSPNHNPPSGGLPTTNVTNAFFALWMDLDFSNSSVSNRRLSYKVSGSEFIITFSNAPRYQGGGTDYVSFQVVLEFAPSPANNTRILVQYDDSKTGSNFISQYGANTLATHLAGLQSSGTNSLTYRFRSTSTVVTAGPIFSSPVAVQFGPDASALPIQLASFTATRSNTRIRLDWTTLSEVNNFGFFVQRKTDGEQQFTDIPNGFIAGHGTTNVPQHYTFTDQFPGMFVLWYRLRQIDLDGTIHYTEPIQPTQPTSVNGKETAPREFALFQNYPNPFNPSTEIKFSVENTGQATLEVFNILGQKVVTLFDDIAEAGLYYRVRFDGANFSSGVYFYKLQSGTRSSLKKTLLLK